MAAKGKAAKANAAASAARSNPYVQRVIEDEDLRQNIVHAYESARDAVNRLTNGKAPHKAVFDDKKLQKNIREAAGALRDAGVALREGPHRKRKALGLGRLMMFGVVGGGLALVASDDLRKKVLDTLFGAEEEFEYTSPAATTGTGAGTPETTAPST